MRGLAVGFISCDPLQMEDSNYLPQFVSTSIIASTVVLAKQPVLRVFSMVD